MRRFSLGLLIVILIVSSVSISGISQNTSNEILNKLGLIPEVIKIIEDDFVTGDAIDKKELIYGALRGILSTLEDPHTRFVPPQDFIEMKEETSGEFGGLGMYIGIEDGILTVISPIDGTPAFKAGVKAKDKITKIDDVSTEGIDVHQAVSKLKGKPGTKVTITILRRGIEKEFDLTITRDIIKIRSVKSIMLKDDIGYIRVSTFNAHTQDEIKDAFNDLQRKGMKKLVIDLRYNAGGLLKSAVMVSDLFLKKGLIVSTKGRAFDQNVNYEAQDGDPLEEIPVVVIINDRSASASEIVAGALQDNKRATIVGRQSYGKGSVQSVKGLSDGSAVSLTTAEYYTPSGKNINIDYLKLKKDKEYAKNKPWGIKPDVIAENSLDKEFTALELLHMYYLAETKIIFEFAKENTDYTDTDVNEIMNKLKEKNINIEEDRIRLSLIDELSRRNENRVYFDLKADSQLLTAVNILQK
ncbi:MAG: S41 family peptidase [Candidatus Hydrogenedentota bacterium]